MLYIFKYEDYKHFDIFNEKILNNNEISYEFKTALNTLVVYKEYVLNNLKFGYSTGKVENTIRFIKQMKNNAFGFRSYENIPNGAHCEKKNFNKVQLTSIQECLILY